MRNCKLESFADSFQMNFIASIQTLTSLRRNNGNIVCKTDFRKEEVTELMCHCRVSQGGYTKAFSIISLGSACLLWIDCVGSVGASLVEHSIPIFCVVGL